MKVFNKDFPIKVKFKKSIFDDSFIEEGMIAYLTKVSTNEEHSEGVVYELHFNQEPFMEHNEILLTECYFQNKYTGYGYNGNKEFYTAKEAGCFDKRWSDYFDVFKGQTFEEVAQQYFEVIE